MSILYSILFFIISYKDRFMQKQSMQNILYNIKSIQKDDIAVITGVVSFGLILYVWLLYSDIEQTSWNLWKTLAYIQIGSHWILSILFWLFIAATIYKIRRTNQRSSTKTSSGLFWWLFSAIVIWCPACSISLASYLWLWTLLVNMPGFGIELKLVWLGILGWATWTTLRDLYVCKINR